ncbi:MAG: hypothetical protein COA79_07905 [Planctomycetota bacterium]|nr:MAG: hypothetical protein COA79_07905 [Planctomycetota bacterium]
MTNDLNQKIEDALKKVAFNPPSQNLKESILLAANNEWNKSEDDIIQIQPEQSATIPLFKFILSMAASLFLIFYSNYAAQKSVSPWKNIKPKPATIISIENVDISNQILTTFYVATLLKNKEKVKTQYFIN